MCIRDSIQQADKYEEYGLTKEKIISIVEAKLAMKSPDDMVVDWLAKEHWQEYGNQENDEEIDWLGKGGGAQCYRCWGQGHISKNCGSPEPAEGKGKGKGKDGKGFGKDKARARAMARTNTAATAVNQDTGPRNAGASRKMMQQLA